jgi:hypothetical protein
MGPCHGSRRNRQQVAWRRFGALHCHSAKERGEVEIFAIVDDIESNYL